MSIETEFLKMALQRLETRALETADNHHMVELNKAILNIYQAIDALADADVDTADLDVAPERMHISKIAVEPFVHNGKVTCKMTS